MHGCVHAECASLVPSACPRLLISTSNSHDHLALPYPFAALVDAASPGNVTHALLLQSVLTSSLDSSSEDVKAVASQALGGVAIGNLSTYLPFILRQIQNQVCGTLLPCIFILPVQFLKHQK